jgi:hypothetical protein
VCTFASAAAARLFASFSAFFARPLSFFAFPPLGAIVVSTWLLSGIRSQIDNYLRVIDYRVSQGIKKGRVRRVTCQSNLIVIVLSAFLSDLRPRGHEDRQRTISPTENKHSSVSPVSSNCNTFCLFPRLYHLLTLPYLFPGYKAISHPD